MKSCNPKNKLTVQTFFNSAIKKPSPSYSVGNNCPILRVANVGVLAKRHQHYLYSKTEFVAHFFAGKMLQVA